MIATIFFYQLNIDLN